MSFIYMPPKFLSPYSGTELGSSENVFCKQVTTTTGGVGTVLTGAAVVDGDGTQVDYTGTQTDSTARDSPTAALTGTTSGSGSGFTVILSITTAAATAQTNRPITLTVTASGTGYAVGDTVTFTQVQVQEAFNAISTLGSSAVDGDIVFTFGAGVGNSLTIYGNVGETGWQTTLPAVSANAQLLSIVIPDDGVDTNDFADANYVVVCNLTGGVAETLAASVGTVTGSIHHDGTLNTDTVTIRRGSSVGLSTLPATDITVRLVKRQLSVPA